MKGLLAPVLVIMMTGMVFSQQHQNDSFSSTGSDSGIKLLRRFLLVMSDDHIEFLKAEGALPASIPIDKQASTDHIEFHGNASNAEREDKRPFNIMQTASLDDDGRLEFMLTDALIEVMRKDGLRYIIREEDRGKYREVLVRYDRPSFRSSQTQTQQRAPRNQAPERNQALERNQQTRTQPIRTESTFNQPLRNQFGQRRRQNEQREIRSRDESPIVGPQLPENYFERSREQRLLGSEIDNRRERQATPLTPRRESTYENDFDSRRLVNRDDRRNDNSINLRPQANRFASETTMTARELDRELVLQSENDRLVAEQRAKLLQEENDRFRLENERTRLDDRLLVRREQPPLTQRNNWATRSNRNEQDDLAFENEKLKRLLQVERSNSAQRERTLELELDREYRSRMAAQDNLRRRNTDLGYSNQPNVRQPINFPSGRFTDGYQADYGDHLVDQYRPQNSYTQVPAKVVNAPRPTNKPPAFSIPGIESNQQIETNRQDVDRKRPALAGDANEIVRRQNRLLWFIMLCSVGLNFYLAIIARGFYVRYEELADEIRETFTSSV